MSGREVNGCATAVASESQQQIEQQIDWKLMIRIRFFIVSSERRVECAQTNASSDIAFFITPPSTTKATISAITRQVIDFFREFGPHNGHSPEGCYNPRHLSFFSLRN